MFRGRVIYPIGLAFALIGAFFSSTVVSANETHEAARDSSTPIVWKTGFALQEGVDSVVTVPEALEKDGVAEPFTSVWACFPDGLELEIRVAEDAATLETAEWNHVDTDHGSDDGPDCASGTTTEGVWVGYAELVQWQIVSGPAELLQETTVFGRSAIDRDDPDTLNEQMVANTVSIVDGDLEIVTREGWGADEDLRNPPNDDANSDQADHITIHHTAGTNDYTKAEGAEIVDGIYTSHTVGNGWNDLGYNFLIDRFGTVYEGRVGSLGTDGGQGFILESPTTTGVHNRGFNTGSVGIALLGTHSEPDEDQGVDAEGESVEGEPVTDAARESLLDLVTAVAGAHSIDLNTVVTRDCILENDYCENDQIVTPRLTYHRTFSATACPGGYAVEQLFGEEFSEIDFAAGEGMADVEAGILEPATEGTLRFEYFAQSEQERTAWMKQILDHELDQEADPTSGETDHGKIREAQRSLVELQREEVEIKRQIAVAKRSQI